MPKHANRLPPEFGYADACLLNNEPPPGCILPVVTRQGDRWALSDEWVPFDALAPTLPPMERVLALMLFEPFWWAAQLHAALAPAGPAWRPSPEEHASIARFLRALIVAELLRRDHAPCRPRDDEATALWVHLFRNQPGYSFRVSAVKRRALARIRRGFSASTSISQ